MVAPALQDAVVRRQGRTVLGPISIAVPGTGLTAVIGPNGSGKTTLLRALHGVERLSSGTLTALDPQRQAFVFQSPVMMRRSVAGNLGYPLTLAGLARADRQARIADWAERIRLTDRLDLPAGRLSGGERQKLALARALIRAPQVLFLDEPCANLDGRSTREIEALLCAARDDGCRIVLATHDMAQARRLATGAWFLLNGVLCETGAQLLAAPHTDPAAAYLRGDIVE